MRNVLVTGGAGFIGSHLCERLLKEDDTYVICVDNLLSGLEENIEHLKSNPRFSFINHDVTQISNFKFQISNFKYIFHLASPASPNHHSKISYHALPMETMMVNTMGTKYLLELAEKHKAKFLFTSTSEIYGDPLEHPQKEEYRGNVSTTGPRSVYDEAKRFGETIVAYFGRDRGVDARITRIFNTYGRRMRKDDMRMISIFAQQALSGQPLTIFGDGQQTRSLCYVDDTVEGIYRHMFYPETKGTVINIGSTEEHRVLTYATIIKKLTQSPSEIIHAEQLPADDPKQRRPDTTKAKQLLDWEPRIPLEQGLKTMIEYFKISNF